MALANAAANAYLQTKIRTATPAELTLMLYDGAIKFCNMGKVAIENNDYEKANYYIQKAKNIIVEFRNVLNFDYPVAKDFDRVYDYIYYVLVQANVKKDTKMLDEGLKRIKEMRETWVEVMDKVKEQKTQVS
ncbi:MAG: flagellar export chaperone FliS [Lachnospiraceae bacterium]|jgi:flagellar protein FliS|nr:flagellar export chaperone FliS [Lachnospiraceae bacterium]